MSDDREWDELAEKIKAVTERMMRAGWLKETLHTSGGLGNEYTPEGMQKMNQLLELFVALDYDTMSTDELNSLRALVRQFGSKRRR